MKENLLWYRQPAECWEEALPLGNGKLGMMVFGGISEEHIQLNEETIWSGWCFIGNMLRFVGNPAFIVADFRPDVKAECKFSRTVLAYAAGM